MRLIPVREAFLWRNAVQRCTVSALYHTTQQLQRKVAYKNAAPVRNFHYTTILCDEKKIKVVAEETTGFSSGRHDEQDVRPKRIILLRTAESKRNINQATCVNIPDWRCTLTTRGHQQAKEAGKQLLKILVDNDNNQENDVTTNENDTATNDQLENDATTTRSANEKIIFFYSPYERTQETLDEILSVIPSHKVVGTYADPRLSQQQKGNFQDVNELLVAQEERRRYGRFFYRYPSGEAGSDVYHRVSSFVSSLFRNCVQYKDHGYNLNEMTVVVITHGSVLRLFLMRWFQFSVAEYEESTNPPFAQLVCLNKIKKGHHYWYELEEEGRQALHLPESCAIPKNVSIYKLMKK
mmetsp:Transcript_7698/g.11057  ORF Transcript_7698/g.11057 Transcript_7698/m.11057 type:complete len:352 (+) Transcript_7698:124-1179(+)